MPSHEAPRWKQVDLGEVRDAVLGASSQVDDAYARRSERHLGALLGEEREAEPTSAHVSYIRRLSPLAATYSKERAVEVCLETLGSLGFDLAANSRIKLDLEDRPQRIPGRA